MCHQILAQLLVVEAYCYAIFTDWEAMPLSIKGTITKSRTTGCLENNGHLSRMVLGAGKSRLKVLADMASEDGIYFCYVLTWGKGQIPWSYFVSMINPFRRVLAS